MTTTLEWIIVISLFAIFFISAIVTTIIIFYRRRWNYTFVVAENTGGSGFTISQRGKMRLVNIGDGGEEIFFLRNIKKYRLAYGKRIANRQVLWTIGKDGYWYNCDFGDFDETFSKMGLIPVEKDVRMGNASMRKMIDKRYDKGNFMEKWGTTIAFGMLFLCIIAMIGFLWINGNQQKTIAGANLESTKTSKEVMALSKEIMTQIQLIKSGSSGYVQPDNSSTPRPVLTP